MSVAPVDYVERVEELQSSRDVELARRRQQRCHHQTCWDRVSSHTREQAGDPSPRSRSCSRTIIFTRFVHDVGKGGTFRSCSWTPLISSLRSHAQPPTHELRSTTQRRRDSTHTTLAWNAQEREREVLEDEAKRVRADAEEEHKRRVAAESVHHVHFVATLLLDCPAISASEPKGCALAVVSHHQRTCVRPRASVDSYTFTATSEPRQFARYTRQLERSMREWAVQESVVGGHGAVTSAALCTHLEPIPIDLTTLKSW